MTSMIPCMPFLRPLGLPRPATVKHFLRFSTTAKRHAEQPERTSSQGQQARQRSHPTQYTDDRQEDRNLVASRTASPTYPPPSMLSDPRPKESRASRRTSHPPKERSYPTRQDGHKPPKQKISRIISDADCAPNLPYYVTRTENKELPVYQLSKRGGNLSLTRIKKIDGNPEVLRDALREKLGLTNKTCIVNPITKHVVIKGHFKEEVESYLRARKF